MSANKRTKKLLKTILKANASCGCGKPKLSDVFSPAPKPKPSLIPQTLALALEPPLKCDSSSSNDGVSETTATTTTTTTTTSDDTEFSAPPPPPPNKRLNDNCIAVVKDSDDPFRDFKQSMKQMIVEKEIYEKNDLEELLACFLELNSTCHSEVIVRAFAEIWNEVVSEKLVINDKKPVSTSNPSEDR